MFVTHLFSSLFTLDNEPKIRETMVKCLVNFITNKHNEIDLCSDVSDTLANIITNDPILEIRLLGIHQVCDLAHNATTESKAEANSSNDRRTPNPPISAISSELLHAVGKRVMSKNKTEHRDAITGLAQIYYKHYMHQILADVQEGGDDCNIDDILDVLREECGLDGKSGDNQKKNNNNKKNQVVVNKKFGWIPQRVFESVSWPDSSDPDMRNRIFQIVDDVLLGSNGKKDTAPLTPTARATGLAIILHSVKDKENARKWLCTLFTQRANLQKALGAYLDARTKYKECKSGSAEAFTLDAEAMEKLEVVASLSARLSPSVSSDEEVQAALKKIHTAKDKHIFRILSTIASPTHSPSARARAFDELPKRTKSLGNATSTWIKTLARRCAMGVFFNAESIEHCIILSQECYEAGDCEASSLFLECVKMATSIFPALGATNEGFKGLVEFFELCRTTSMTAGMKKEMEKCGLVTMISDILAKTASSRPASGGKVCQWGCSFNCVLFTP